MGERRGHVVIGELIRVLHWQKMAHIRAEIQKKAVWFSFCMKDSRELTLLHSLDRDRVI